MFNQAQLSDRLGDNHRL